MAPLDPPKKLGRRTYWTTAWVRAEDLDKNLVPSERGDGSLVRVSDVARIEGRWRWIYGTNEEEVPEIKEILDDLNESRIVVRYAVDERSTSGEYEDAFIVLNTTDLVEVQVPVVEKEG